MANTANATPTAVDQEPLADDWASALAEAGQAQPAASGPTIFNELGAAFSAANPGVTVVFNFAGSNQLATQIAAGQISATVIAEDECRMRRFR